MVATKLGVEAQLINKENEDDAMKELLKLIFNETIDVTAITDEVFSELVILFKERQANNTLPPPLIKKHEEITIEIKESDDINDKMTALFGDGMFDIVD